ncbi:right-handed parallel beta-helix repeat-containing protein [Parabacteroides sp. OttesenSCG-928-G06]|nr:right-handed parallel beta-helix repeat-containing protein [Parabacteroides sp. OttesenSCG-928-G06]
MKKKLIYSLLFPLLLFSSCVEQKVYDLADYGLKPNTGENASPLFAAALEAIQKECGDRRQITLTLPAGRYDFHPEGAAEKEYFISNHDQDNPKRVGLPFENMKNIVFDAQGSELIFHGRMLPVSLIHSENCTLKNFHIDFINPHISQVKVVENDTVAGFITYEVAPWVQYEIRDSAFVAKGKDWEHIPRSGIAFEGDTKRLVYQTSDIRVGSRRVKEIAPRRIRAPWNDKRLIPGTVVAMRGSGRPTPGIFLTNDKNTNLENIQIHYAEGMGLLAQMSENITLDGLSVCLRGENDWRYFTTQADATHFSGCKGKIISQNGLYEGMMDDAINIHGTYLKVVKRVDDRTLHGRYMHGQSYGFEWGRVGDAVQFIQSNTMELIGETNKVTAIEAVDKPDYHGAKEFRITFEKPLDPAISEAGTFGIENLEWTPEVVFAHNVIRNNRARGTLFSTPKPTLIEDNYFDHTSGTAILLCGDCNGWFETGACHDVVIRKNRFVNALTNMFQFTNAVISIYPEIPNLKEQKRYFHSGIVIEDNVFETFDNPILYAKSVDGLIFRNNTITHNDAYPAFHWNKHPFYFQRVTNYTIENNQFDNGFDPEKEVRVEE